MDLVEHIHFYINDKKHTAPLDGLDINMSLNTYLRNNLNLTGTKKMCAEGGCGVCVVAVKKKNQHTGKLETVALNSCLVSIFSSFGWSIYTVEGIGDKNNPNAIQKALCKFNGTQCGFCTPGMVMNLFALNEKQDLTMKTVENSFGGNICRCTGYRPILSAFKSLCTDLTKDCLGTVSDIEDLTITKKGYNKNCDNSCHKNPLLFKLLYSSWIKVFNLSDLLKVIETLQSGEKKSSYMLIAGNTGQGVYKVHKKFDVYIDINNVKELHVSEIKNNELIIGGNISLTQAIDNFNDYAKNDKCFKYLEKVAEHIDLVANVAVRNGGTIAGNLMLKHQHKDFPSDIFLILETLGAQLTIVDPSNKEYYGSPEEFLSLDMTNKVIRCITLPGLSHNHEFASYKIMPRSQNAHALLNAGFLFKFDDQKKIESFRIVYGNISKSFIHAKKVEDYLVGNNIFNNDVLQRTFELLDEEIVPEFKEMGPSIEFRKKLSISLFYKFILSISETVRADMKSGAVKMERTVSKGTQDFQTNASLYPLSENISKLEAMIQSTGEAQYIADMPDQPNQLFACFVLAKAPANSIIKKINAEKVLKLNGVVAFYGKNDIPGKNTFTPKVFSELFIEMEEELFCSGVVQYYHQPIGVVVARTQELAEKAADLVDVQYGESKVKPLVSIRDVLKANRKEKIVQDRVVLPVFRGEEDKHIIKGMMDLKWQSHFHMENHCCNVYPNQDGGLDMYPASQWMDLSQNAAAAALNLPANKINVVVKRLGGGFGGKIIRNSQISTAAALCAFKLQKPVKMWLPLKTNFRIIGKRHPLSCDYEAAVDDDGIIQYINNLIYFDHGVGKNCKDVFLFLDSYLGCYNTTSWFTNTFLTHTDMHPSCYIRAPGSLEGITTVESIMEHIAINIGMDSLDFRLANLNPENTELLSYIVDFIDWADIASRKLEINRFNKVNKWRKKGLSVIPMVFPFEIFFSFNVIVSIHHLDGTVSIAHGGVEIGQGINTKAAQVCAYKLGIPVNKISVKPTNNLVSPNVSMTGASMTSEGVCYSVIKACSTLLKRMEPIKDKLDNPTWEEIVKQCYFDFIDLTAMGMYSKNDEELGGYNVYGVCAAEVELDVLTAQYTISRVDLLEDVGDSINPKIDIGQIEGAFVMGLGYFLTEDIKVSEQGEILSDRTWNYYPPGPKDIPIDFRVKFPKDNPNEVGVLKSKATGEPAICLAVAIPLAIRQAVAEVRGYFDPTSSKWFKFGNIRKKKCTYLFYTYIIFCRWADDSGTNFHELFARL
ncbi:unnamed protein product [Brassicogethes aeneus]|uniref:Indole-3-acetaldehyde oxidase n=1 Tax=Brassicogethes aeneus TaxID=1431903 RepID=A0A9P0BFD4_BRAAE|nr:unnamed protein product [Brassicogethes aeneus]